MIDPLLATLPRQVMINQRPRLCQCHILGRGTNMVGPCPQKTWPRRNVDSPIGPELSDLERYP
jgi:hypothetical protein